MSRWEMLWEIVAGVSVFLLPIALLFIGSAFGLK